MKKIGIYMRWPVTYMTHVKNQIKKSSHKMMGFLARGSDTAHGLADWPFTLYHSTLVGFWVSSLETLRNHLFIFGFCY